MAVGQIAVSKKKSDPSGSMHLRARCRSRTGRGTLELPDLVVLPFAARGRRELFGSRAHAEGEAEGPRGADSSIAQSSTIQDSPCLLPT